MSYKHDLEVLIDSFGKYFIKPSSGAREKTLAINGKNVYADFSYDIKNGGKLFIEDDDAPRALNNLIKYWRWCFMNEKYKPIHLIHIIGELDSIYIDHCRFLKEHIENELSRNQFHYHLITHNNQWSNPDKWLLKIKYTIEEIILKRKEQRER